jgi:hypothetical protein
MYGWNKVGIIDFVASSRVRRCGMNCMDTIAAAYQAESSTSDKARIRWADATRGTTFHQYNLALRK